MKYKRFEYVSVFQQVHTCSKSIPKVHEWGKEHSYVLT